MEGKTIRHTIGLNHFDYTITKVTRYQEYVTIYLGDNHRWYITNHEYNRLRRGEVLDMRCSSQSHVPDTLQIINR